MENVNICYKMTYIYLIENCYGDPNKVYIGKTINSREHDHKKTYGNQINYVIIDKINSLSRNEWEPLETYWIEQFRQWGYKVMNIRKKGGGGVEFCSEQHKNKIGKANSGKKQSKELIKKRLKNHNWKEIGLKISKAKKGHKCYNNEWKNKISKSLKEKDHSIYYTKEIKEKISKSKGNKSVLQYDLQGNFIKEWEYLSLAKKDIKGDIQACCVGKQKTAGGYIWKYKIN